jgi:hypothetical protein
MGDACATKRAGAVAVSVMANILGLPYARKKP